jgi:hypothetical protein
MQYGVVLYVSRHRLVANPPPLRVGEGVRAAATRSSPLSVCLLTDIGMQFVSLYSLHLQSFDSRHVSNLNPELNSPSLLLAHHKLRTCLYLDNLRQCFREVITHMCATTWEYYNSFQTDRLYLVHVIQTFRLSPCSIITNR